MQNFSNTYGPISNHISTFSLSYFKDSKSKRIFFSFLILLSFLFSAFMMPSHPPTDKFVVVIDPGHGGKDPGTSGKFSKEKDIALAISLKVGKYIEENLKDVKVLYTRKTDVYPEVHERADFANKNKADLFMSIHVDGFANTKVYGTSSFVMGLAKNDESLAVAQRENAVIMKEDDYKSKYGGFDPNSPESYIRISLEQNAYLELSLSLAAKIQDQFKNRAMRKSRGVQQAGFLVLWRTTMPAVLIETGFLTNPAEEKFLNTEHGQDLMASGIYRAFRDYKNEISAKTVSEEELQKLDSLNMANSTPDDSGIRFKVQIASSTKQIEAIPKNFSGIENVQQIEMDGRYKYTVGNQRDYQSAYTLYKKIKKKIPDAFLVAFKDGEKISVKKAKKELRK